MIYHSTILLNVKGPQDFYPFKICHCKNMIAMVHEFHNCRTFHEKFATIIIYTIFVGIDTPKGANETLITVQYHTHPFSAAPISWGRTR